MKATGYRQCLLERATIDGYERLVTYLPEPWGREGQVVKLKDGETWTDGWRVLSAGSLQDAELVEAREKAVRNLIVYSGLKIST